MKGQDQLMDVMTKPPHDSRTRLNVRRIGLIGAPLMAMLVYLVLPTEYLDESEMVTPFTMSGRLTLALMVWMGGWWLTEALDVEATALLPLVYLPALGISSISAAAQPYASPLIFLFLGGFLLAIGMQRHGLDRRIALLTLRMVGSKPTNLIGGFMVATAVMSSCVSNTATVAMMIPIGLGVSRLVESRVNDETQVSSFKVALMLSIAYSASIGGLATLIGSPPNGFLAQYASDNLGIEVTFLDWLAVGLPLTVILLPISWLLLTRWLYSISQSPIEGGRELIAAEWKKLGPLSRGERLVFIIFVGTVAAWTSRPAIAQLLPQISDGGIAITAGLLLFLMPVDRAWTVRVLTWKDTKELPWGVLILFGGGLSLASAVGETGVADFIGSLARGLNSAPTLIIVLGITAGMVFLTELTSNTASAATIVPVLVALAPGLGLTQQELAVPATLAASCAFMLPVATPPNAIVFGSGQVTIAEMSRAGIWMNLAATAAITTIVYGVVLRLIAT